MDRKNILEFETRRKIYNLILNHPGLHLREISREMSISYGAVGYHLYHLEKQEIINSVDHKFYKRYYVKYKITPENKKIISILRESTPKKIIIYLIYNTCATRKDISDALEKTPQTISYHIKRLSELGIIEPAIIRNGHVYLAKTQTIFERRPTGSEVLYKLKNGRTIYNSLIAYPGCASDIPDIDIILHYFDYVFSKDFQKIFTDADTVFGRMIEKFYNVFPHPYHV
jgi:DNA-binding MarR family transcriptional regulator